MSKTYIPPLPPEKCDLIFTTFEKTGCTLKKLAKEFGLYESAISGIISRKLREKFELKQSNHE